MERNVITSNENLCEKCIHKDVCTMNNGDKTVACVSCMSFDGYIDIHKIIDDAIEKKDRSVTIHIGESGTVIYVDPITNKKPRWIEKGYDYACSECGRESRFAYPHCPFCGEELAKSVEEDTDNGEV